MQTWLKSFVSISVVVVTTLLLYGCATWEQKDFYASRNTGDNISSSLKLGMTIDEIRAIVSASSYKDYVKEEPLDSILTEREIYRLYGYAQYPKEILADLKIGAKYRRYSYWITPNSNEAIYLFFDAQGGLRGWANYPSGLTFERFWHERLTSKLRWAGNGLQKGMTHSEVYALIGKPTEIIDAPEESRAVYEDHFWCWSPNWNPEKQKMEVYTYPLSNGAQRRVYLLYYPAADELNDCGYDNAWEEGERYIREKKTPQK